MLKIIYIRNKIIEHPIRNTNKIYKHSNQYSTDEKHVKKTYYNSNSDVFL